MNFFRRAFANNEKAWRSLRRPVVFLLFCIVLYFFDTVYQNDAARRQQTSDGTIGQCEIRGRGNENFCHYTFAVGDEEFTGVSQAPSGLQFNQTVVVYYDRRDPSVSSLEDFSERAHKSRRFIYLLITALVSVVAFVLWDKSPYREPPSEISP